MKKILLTILGRLSLIVVLMFQMFTVYSREITPAVKQSIDNSKSVYATWLMIWIQKHPNTASWFTEKNVNNAQIYLNGEWRGWDWSDNTFVDDAMSKLHAAGINVLVLDLTNGWGWQDSVVKEIQKRCDKYEMKVCIAENSTGVLKTFEDHASYIYEKFAGPNAAYGDTYFKKDGKPLIVCYAIREWYNSYIKSTGVNRSKFALVWASGEDAEVNKWGWQLVPQVGALPSKESMYVSPSVKYSPADKHWRSHLASLDYNFTLARLNSAKYIIVGSYDDIPERNGWLPAKTDSVIPSCQFQDIYGNSSIDAYYNRVKEWTKGTPGSVAGGLIEDGAYRFSMGKKQMEVFKQDGIVGQTLNLSAKTEEMSSLFYLYHLGNNEYRIVALSGGLSLEAHADNTISQEYDTPEYSQRWTIEKRKNGNFTVRNKQNQGYLSSDQTDNVLLKTNPQEWMIEAGLTISGKGFKAIVAQTTYAASKEREEAGMGVERVARLFTGTYDSRQAENADAIRWVQIDLGERKKIEGIKLLPKVLQWNYVSSEGFPSRFKIEVSDDPAFKDAVLYANQLEVDFRDPQDEVCTFSGKVVTGRYVRLTATALRQKKLALTKLMVLSEGKDIAEGCPASDSESDNQRASILTRPLRPQGEGVVTDNPGNIIAKSKWRPVDYKAQTPKGGVTLGDGLFKKTMEKNISYLMTLFTFDELVRNFRVKGGKPVQPLDNRLNNMWFVDLPGQEAGSFLMGAGNTLRWMENAGLRDEMNQIVDVIDACKEPDGYIMAYPKNKIFSGEYGAYTRSWVTHGLIEAGYAGNKKAFPLLRGFYDWFNTSCYLPEMLRRTGQGTQGIIPSARMYFTPVGKPKDIQVIQQYFQENYWMEQMATRDVKAIWLYPYDRPHNYLLTGIEPYLDMYRATGAKKYLDASLGAWDLYHDNWEHVGGSIAITEGTDLYPPKSYFLHRSTGELCGSVFWSFLNQRFHLLYPEEEKYVAEIEQSIYNNLIANQFDNKGFRYHSNLVGHKDTQLFGLCTCCEGQGTRMTGSIPEFIYSTADDGVYVNLFASSTITFTNHSRTLSLQMATQFPYDPTVQLTVNTEKPLKSSIRIRVPSWAAKKMSVRINGEVIADGNPGTYVTLDRKWKNGDVISFTLPMAFKLTKYTGEEKAYIGRFALEYGPILMAYVRTNGQQGDPRLQTSAESIENNLIPVSGKPLHFRIRGVDGFEYKPYFEVENEAFSCFP